MIGILLITHGSFGEALVQNACHVLNKRPVHVNQLGVSAQDDPLDLLPLALQMLELVDNGDGVLVLTVNLPMLLRALTYRDKGMEILLQRARDGGREGVFNMLEH